MRLRKVTADRVQIPQRLAPLDFARTLIDPAAAIVLNVRSVQLQSREWNGRTVRAAYDRETDTLFIKDD